MNIDPFEEHVYLEIVGYFINKDYIERRIYPPSRFAIWLRRILFKDVYVSLIK